MTEPEAIVAITRYEVSVLPPGDTGRRHFALYVEPTPRGWVVHDGHSGFTAAGTVHHGEAHLHPFANLHEAVSLARHLAPGLTVNGITAAEAYHLA